MDEFFPGFLLQTVPVGDVQIRFRSGGSGPPLLLLHGHPRTHATWYAVAPRLADRFSVVCPDLRGYGESSKPVAAEDGSTYSKRAMARDCIALMRRLGYERFAVAGHDRGSYVAFRVAMDYPEAVGRLIVMDSVPIGAALSRCDARFATAWWHWFFLGNRHAGAERVINLDPDAWYRTARAKGRMAEAAWLDFHAAVHNPETVRAMCEDYRSGLTADREHDDADHDAGRRVACPTLVLWSTRDDLATLYGDPVAVWREWATDVRGQTIESGHHVAEEASEAVAAALDAFLSARAE